MEFEYRSGDHVYLFLPSGAVSLSSSGKIAYVTNWNQSLGLAGLYTLDMDGNNLNLLVTLPEGRFFESPVFSPDGR
jgi:Tol biopolymer transport system component